MRVLFIGENWYGSNGRSCVEALRRLGCNVLDVDEQTFIPQVRLFTSRVVRRLLWPRMVTELNQSILHAARIFRPDFVLAFKGPYMLASTLQSLRSHGYPLYNYYPDTSAFTHGPWLPKSLPGYDCVFYTKPFWYDDVSQRVKLKAAVFLPHGYDPALHRPHDLDARDIADYSCDVSLIAFHTRYKEDMLAGLIAQRPEIDLRIWGAGWVERCQSPGLLRCIQGYPLLGESYSRAIQASRVNLGIMSGRVAGASSSDLTTSRTYTIPASGGFMLHERNSEVLGLYKEGEEFACFDSVEELARKIDTYLARPLEREQISKAGHARCVPAYSYDNRVAEILSWHHEHGQSGNC